MNLQGEVVGISAMKALAADGVSFAIPVDTALNVMRQLRQHGRVIRPYAGPCGLSRVVNRVSTNRWCFGQ